MLCQNCHQEIPEDFTICPFCGASQVNPEYAKAQAKKVNITFSWFVTFGLLLVLLVGTLYLKSNDYLFEEIIDNFNVSLHQDKLIKQLDDALIRHHYIEYQQIMDTLNYSYNEAFSDYYDYSNLLYSFINIQDNLSSILENRQSDYKDHYLELSKSVMQFNEESKFLMRHATNNQIAVIDTINRDLRVYFTNTLNCSNEQVEQLLSSGNSSTFIALINELLKEGDSNE